ncbi:chemosensory receptor C [Elysia marginata]|uniref:Chemosensory receptor C n=1 Tax=Elysia marginata TaxID=1093978 RepID=A0AAV4FJ89_9GAST|nr:chemosensory receptor C [Elysia marginata]
MVLEVAFHWYCQIFYDFSCFTSVFLGLVRCACVAKLLLFKSMFTITRTLIILAVLFVAAISLRVPVMTVFRIAWMPKPESNSTWLSIQVSPNFREIFTATDIVNRNVVTWVAYTIALACVIVLVTNLRTALKFRQSLASQTAAQGPTGKQKTLYSVKDDSIHQHDILKTMKEFNQQKKISQKLSPKDVQVIQSVTLICAIFIFSQFPLQLHSTVRLFDPEFALGRKKTYMFGSTIQLALTCTYINASINILVHYYFNSR